MSDEPKDVVRRAFVPTPALQAKLAGITSWKQVFGDSYEMLKKIRDEKK